MLDKNNRFLLPVLPKSRTPLKLFPFTRKWRIRFALNSVFFYVAAIHIVDVLIVYVHILISLGRKQTVARSAPRMSCLALSFRVLAGNASSGFKVLCQENNSFITVLLVSSPRFITSVENEMKVWLSDKQQIGFIQPSLTEYDVHDVLYITAPCKKKGII